MPYAQVPGVYYVAALCAAGGPIYAALLTVAVPPVLALRWRSLPNRDRVLGLGLWLVAAATIALAVSPTGRLIMVWWAD